MANIEKSNNLAAVNGNTASIEKQLALLPLSQSFEIQNTQNTTFQIATTALTQLELSTVELPPNITISHTLTPKTRFLVTYKAVFTEKYIQALHWNIPIVNTQFLHNITSNYKAFEIRPFQGAVFSTSGISDEIYNNYFILLGARYEPNCSVFIDFLICDNEDSEKYTFCRKYEIPVIRTSQVFTGDYTIFKKKTKYDAKQLQPKAMFIDRVFYINPKLPKQLFNKLRRIVIENEGTRVSLINSETEFIITHTHDELGEHASRLIHYQYIFDCVESNSLLYPDFYRLHPPTSKVILRDVISVVDINMDNAAEYLRKLKSLGSAIRGVPDLRCTHYFTRGTGKIKQLTGSGERVPYRILTPDWIDQCLTMLRHVKEGRFSSSRPVLGLKKKLSLKKHEDVVFQFTGLPAFFKDEAIKKFRSYGVRFIDSEKFENCTHLIMGSLCLSEKFLCGVVSGCWILTPDFIQDFENQANFDYEKYEWVGTAGMTPRDKKTADSIRRWRTQIQTTGRKPFRHWNVKFYSAEAKLESYRSLIAVGGGETTDAKAYTHVFIDKSFTEKVDDERAVSADSIFSYIFK